MTVVMAENRTKDDGMVMHLNMIDLDTIEVGRQAVAVVAVEEDTRIQEASAGMAMHTGTMAAAAAAAVQVKLPTAIMAARATV